MSLALSFAIDALPRLQAPQAPHNADTSAHFSAGQKPTVELPRTATAKATARATCPGLRALEAKVRSELHACCRLGVRSTKWRH